MNIYPSYVSKHNLNYENEIILLMILNGEGWHYLAVNELSALFREKRQNIMMIFIVYIEVIPLQQKTNLNRINKYVKVKVFVVL